MHFAVVITLSAFLIFLVQPLIAKQILPWFGGSAAVWTTCMVFFQTALLAGYAYADWAPRRFGVARHARIHAILVAISLVALPITVSTFWKPVDGAAPVLQILGLLTATIGLPYVVLSATSPLVQIWFSRVHPERDPYRLFALSNTASLVALLCYPFLVEPRLVLRAQAWGWSLLYLLFMALMITLAIRVYRRAEPLPSATDLAATQPVLAAGAAPTGREQLWWLVLAGTASALLLAVTNHVTENIASVPMLWLMPLTIYLLTFILCFDGQRWYVREMYFGPILIAIGAMGWLIVDKSHQFDLITQSVVFGLGLFVVCMFCHGELVAAKPHPRFLGRFYAIVSLGGALGSAVVAFVAPVVLSAYYEVTIILVFAALLVALAGRIWSRRAFVIGLAGVVGAGAIVWRNVAHEQQDAVWVGRNFYGALKVQQFGTPESENYRRRLVHGAIMHGEQFQAPNSSGYATSYYTASSGIGRAIDIKEKESPAIRVGMIGLGVGTIATYGRKEDVFRFYEINAEVPKVANEYFTYLKESEAKVDIVLGDARLSIEREPPQKYDVLAVDAFTGDAIPSHLITREAVQLFRRHLAEGGILAYHVSNRYLDLSPVLGIIAGAEKLSALQIDDYQGLWDNNPIKSPSTWVLLAEKPETLAALQEFGKEPAAKPEWRIWTDDYHNLFQVLRSWTGS